jgi:hypothetical protein
MTIEDFKRQLRKRKWFRKALIQHERIKRNLTSQQYVEYAELCVLVCLAENNIKIGRMKRIMATSELEANR